MASNRRDPVTPPRNAFRRIGRANFGEFASTVVYEALVELRCEDCGETIAVGERFSRHQRSGGGPRSFPFCQRCEPFGPVRENT